MSREMIAYALIAISTLGLTVRGGIVWRRWQRVRLRRRGIKRYDY